MTHDYDGELVVFLIGMRINKWWRPDRWLPVLAAMPRMLAELRADPDSGMLGYRIVVEPPGPWLVQYWNSIDKLYDYAGDPDSRHHPAWARFNRRTRASGAVGAWHETYLVQRAETIYVDTPVQGLARATGVRPVTGGLHTARQRFGRHRRDDS